LIILNLMSFRVSIFNIVKELDLIRL
jgi:hypothetical protein